jgi:hypothetical protein
VAYGTAGFSSVCYETPERFLVYCATKAGE